MTDRSQDRNEIGGRDPVPDPGRDLERDFSAFRDRGDAEALARVFDTAAPRLLLVAEHLTRDGARAEDLVQTAFLAAIEDAGSWNPRRPLMPWLTGILAHRAADLGRRAQLRGTPGSGSPDRLDPSAPDPADVAAGRELAARAARAIDELPEPVRRVLVLRLVHGLAPTEIAHALGESPGTVRMRLKRGRDRLREELPEARAVPAFLLLETGRGLEAVRDAVLSRGAEIAAASAAAAGAGTAVATAPVSTFSLSTLLGGALAMKTTILVGAVFFATALWWVRTQAVGPRDRTGAGAQPAETAAIDPPVRTIAPIGTAEAAGGRAVAPAASAAVRTAALTVHVLSESDGSARAGVGVYARPADGLLGVEAHTGADGTAHLADLSPGVWRVDLDRWAEASVPVELTVGAERTLTLSLPVGVAVDGRVLDLAGEPVAGASVFRVTTRHHDLLQLAAVADEVGRFQLTDAAPDTRLVARAEGHQPSEATRIRGDAGEVGMVVLELGANGQRLTGVVRDAAGGPVAHALVAIAVDEDAREEPDGMPFGRDEPRKSSKAPDLEAFFVRADAAGRFETGEVPAGRVRVFARPPEARGAAEFVAWTIVDVALGSAQEIVLRMRPGAVIEGRLADASGRALGGLVVEAEWEGTDELGQTEDELGPWIGDRRTTSAADGGFALVGLLPGEYDLRVLVPETGDPGEVLPRGEELLQDELELSAGERARWDPLLETRATLFLRVLDPRGEPLEGWGVGTSDREGELDARALTPAATDAEGRHRVEHLELRRWQVSVHAPTPAEGLVTVPAAVRTGLVPGPDEVVVRLRQDEMPTARLAGRVVDGRGRPLDAAEAGLRLEREGWRETRIHSDLAPDPELAESPGAFRTPPLAPGTYRLLARPRGMRWTVPVGTWTLGIGDERDVGTIALPEPAALAVTLRAADGGAIRDPQVRLTRVDPSSDEPAWSRTISVRPSEDGIFRFEGLREGAYDVTGVGNDVTAGFATARVAAGDEAHVEVRCPRGREQTFVVVVGDAGGATESRLHFRIDDAAGQRVADNREDAPFGPDGLLRLTLRLAPGTYTGTVEHHPRGRSFAGERAPLAFEVPAEGAVAPLVVEIR